MCVVFMIDTKYKYELVAPTEERLGVEPAVVVIMNFNSNWINRYDEMGNTLIVKVPYTYSPKILDLDMKNRATSLAKPSIEEPLVLELKAFLSYLRYAFLGENNTYLVIIVDDLLEQWIEALVFIFVEVQKSHWLDHCWHY